MRQKKIGRLSGVLYPFPGQGILVQSAVKWQVWTCCPERACRIIIEAYQELHHGRHPGETGKGKENPLETAQAFLADILKCQEQKYDSVGHGTDYRYEGGKIVGSALIHEDTVIHMAFFRITQAEKAGSMAGLSRRRSFRQ